MLNLAILEETIYDSTFYNKSHMYKLPNMAEPEPTVETDKKDDEPASFECRKCYSPLQIMAIRKPAYLPRAPPSTKYKK
jgi:hypothetical protein